MNLRWRRCNGFSLTGQRQVVKIQVPAGGDDYAPMIDDVLIQYTE